jgi:predicted DNA-binding transcriptional regulator AlpA
MSAAVTTDRSEWGFWSSACGGLAREKCSGFSFYLTVPLAVTSAPLSVRAMTMPDPEGSAAREPEAVQRGWPYTDRLISAGDIRALFKLGRTAAYELTHRPGFPDPVQVSSRRLRWRASEADNYAPNMRRPGADLITHYLNPGRLPVEEPWSRKHADTQRRLCERFAAPVIGPVIGVVACQDIKTRHTQAIVNAAPTAGEGSRVQRMISALASAGLDGSYLVNPRLAKVHWQAGDRPVPAPTVSVAGESAPWVDPAEIPSHGDVAGLGRALGAGANGERDELMANTAAYSGAG